MVYDPQYARLYYLKNRDHLLANSSRWNKANPERIAEAARRWRKAHPDRRRSQARKLMTRNKEFIRSKKDVACADCKVKYHSWVMEFDHRDPSSKRFTLSDISASWSIERLEEEIAKCDVVCANCHRQRTYSRHTSTCL